MKAQSLQCHIVAFTFGMMLVVGTSAFAQEGQLNLHVTPKQAYLFVDDKAISEASKHSSLNLSAGEHKIELVNYGYKPIAQTVTIAAGKTTDLDVTLEKVGEKVSGPFGAIAIKGADRDAVLLNGKTTDFVVGHGDEFNTDFLWWKQDLVVPPGTYEVTIRSGDKDVWSGQVSVSANQRVIVDVPKGVSRSEPWHRGEKLASVPRFTAGVASATVAVAKPSAQLSATNSQVYCGETSELKWSSSDAPQVVISPGWDSRGLWGTNGPAEADNDVRACSDGARRHSNVQRHCQCGQRDRRGSLALTGRGPLQARGRQRRR